MFKVTLPSQVPTLQPRRSIKLIASSQLAVKDNLMVIRGYMEKISGDKTVSLSARKWVITTLIVIRGQSQPPHRQGGELKEFNWDHKTSRNDGTYGTVEQGNRETVEQSVEQLNSWTVEQWNRLTKNLIINLGVGLAEMFAEEVWFTNEKPWLLLIFTWSWSISIDLPSIVHHTI